MKKTTQFIFSFLIITSLFLTACSQEDVETYAQKAHKDEYLVEKECYTFSDGTSVDYYERIDGYYFLSGTEDCLMQVDLIPEIWNYDDVEDAMSQSARETLQKSIEALSLYDRDALLDNAYADYVSCQDSDESEEVFQFHTVLVNGLVDITSDALNCEFSISYPSEGHFIGELIGDRQSYSFDLNTGTLIE